MKLPKVCWKLHICKGLIIEFSSNQVPNRIHRLMQHWILGFIWEQVK